jgi:site-specific recombinase XerD
MPKVYIDGEEFESLEDYYAAMEARSKLRAPFAEQAEALVDEFIDHMYAQGLPEHTISEHGENIDMLVYFLTQYTEETDLAGIRERVVSREFFDWLRQGALRQVSQPSVERSVKVFFRFLAEEKGIYNSYILGRPR